MSNPPKRAVNVAGSERSFFRFRNRESPEKKQSQGLVSANTAATTKATAKRTDAKPVGRQRATIPAAKTSRSTAVKPATATKGRIFRAFVQNRGRGEDDEDIVKDPFLKQQFQGTTRDRNNTVLSNAQAANPRSQFDLSVSAARGRAVNASPVGLQRETPSPQSTQQNSFVEGLDSQLDRMRASADSTANRSRLPKLGSAANNFSKPQQPATAATRKQPSQMRLLPDSVVDQRTPATNLDGQFDSQRVEILDAPNQTRGLYSQATETSGSPNRTRNDASRDSIQGSNAFRQANSIHNRNTVQARNSTSESSSIHQHELGYQPNNGMIVESSSVPSRFNRRGVSLTGSYATSYGPSDLDGRPIVPSRQKATDSRQSDSWRLIHDGRTGYEVRPADTAIRVNSKHNLVAPPSEAIPVEDHFRRGTDSASKPNEESSSSFNRIPQLNSFGNDSADIQLAPADAFRNNSAAFQTPDWVKQNSVPGSTIESAPTTQTLGAVKWDNEPEPLADAESMSVSTPLLLGLVLTSMCFAAVSLRRRMLFRTGNA